MPPPPPPPRRGSSVPPPPPSPRAVAKPAAFQQRVIDDLDVVDTNSYDLAPEVVSPVPVGEKWCPGCGMQMRASAVLCLKCGFDTRTGRQRFNPVVDKPQRHGESSFMRVVGWFEYGLAGLSVICALVALAMNSSPKDATAIGTIGLVPGFLVLLSGKLRILSALAQEGWGYVFIYMFVPFGALVLTITRWDITRRGVLVVLIGLAAIAIDAAVLEYIKPAL